MDILSGILSPDSAPGLRSSVLAVMTFADLVVLLLLVSLLPVLAPVVGGEGAIIWKLCELVVAALVELISLGEGLSGGGSTVEGFDSWLFCVSVRFILPGEMDSRTLSKGVCLTLALTLPRLLIGSRDIMRGFGMGV